MIRDSLLHAPAGDTFSRPKTAKPRRAFVATGPETATSIEEVPGKWPAAASLGLILGVCGAFWGVVGAFVWLA